MPSIIGNLIAPLGALGLDVFYILSGYLVMKSYASSNTLRDYWRKRLGRTLPLYYFWLIILMIFQYNWISRDPFAIIRAIFMLEYILPPTTSYEYCSMFLTGVLTIFMMFYAMVPLISKFVTSLKRAFVGFWIIIATAVLLYWLMTTLYRPFCDATQLRMMTTYLFRAVPIFAEGVLLYWGKKEKKIKQMFLMQASILLVVIGCVVVHFTGIGLGSMQHGEALMMLAWPFVTLVVMILVSFPISLGKLGNLMRYLEQFGMGVFITQALCFELAHFIFSKVFLPYILQLGILILLPWCCAILVYYCVEIPGKRLVDKIMKPATIT